MPICSRPSLWRSPLLLPGNLIRGHGNLRKVGWHLTSLRSFSCLRIRVFLHWIGSTPFGGSWLCCACMRARQSQFLFFRRSVLTPFLALNAHHSYGPCKFTRLDP